MEKICLLCLMVRSVIWMYSPVTSKHVSKIAVLFSWQTWPLAKFKMEFTAENLERAVVQFYHTDATMQAHAHQWLTAAQMSTEAWCFVWELLHPSKVITVKQWITLLVIRKSRYSTFFQEINLLYIEVKQISPGIYFV